MTNDDDNIDDDEQRRQQTTTNDDIPTTTNDDDKRRHTDMFFGTSIAIDKPYGRDDVSIIVSAPGIATAYVFFINLVTNSWVQQAKLTAHDATLTPEDWFEG
jgi:hypothetical protein